MNPQGVATRPVFRPIRTVEGWCLPTLQWIPDAVKQRILEQTGVEIIRATAGEWERTTCVYAQQPATTHQLLLTEILLSEYIQRDSQ